MTYPSSRLREMTEEELWKEFDMEVSFGKSDINRYLVELVRRSQEKQTSTVICFTKWIFGMTAVITIATLVNVYFAFRLSGISSHHPTKH